MTGRPQLPSWNVACALVLLASAGCYSTHELVPDASGAASGAAADGGNAAGASGSDHGNHDSGPSGGHPLADGGQLDGRTMNPPADSGADANPPPPPPPPPPSTEPNLRVAILGDQSVNSNARAVLDLVRDEGAQVLLIAGDLGYSATPAEWHAQIDAALGPWFPYFGVVGNHEAALWYGPGNYQEIFAAQLARIAGARCTGDLGVNMHCTYRGLSFVLSGVGTLGEDHEAFLDQALATDDIFRLCVWHKNQHDMQTEGKLDEVGWAAYQVCQAHGAPIFTGHAHSYSRTYALRHVGDGTLWHGMFGLPNVLELGPGRTAVWVTALGGMSTRAWNGENNPWWATIYTGNYQLENAALTGTSPTIEFGAVFIDFHVDHDPYKARGYFKTTSGQVVDRFELRMRK